MERQRPEEEHYFHFCFKEPSAFPASCMSVVLSEGGSHGHLCRICLAKAWAGGAAWQHGQGVMME